MRHAERFRGRCEEGKVHHGDTERRRAGEIRKPKVETRVPKVENAKGLSGVAERRGQTLCALGVGACRLEHPHPVCDQRENGIVNGRWA